MQRRSFLTLLGGAAASSAVLRPRAGHPQDGRIRLVGVLEGGACSQRDPGIRLGLAIFREALAKHGWSEGRNLRLDVRFGAGNLDLMREAAAQLVAQTPDAIVTVTATATQAVQRQTKSIPIVFTAVGGDPVGSGLTGSIARPDGNVTGFTNLFDSISGKWMELLKEAAPNVARVAVIFHPDVNPGIDRGTGYGPAIDAAAPTLGVELTKAPVRDGLELVRALDAFASRPNGGLLVLPPGPTGDNRGLTTRLAAQHRLPTIFGERSWIGDGGLMSYGSIAADRYRGAALYVDRVLRGTKVSELPVQYPSRFELVVNLRTAKAIGLTIPEAFLLRADELIE
jgi:putative ABC transport system substrate-binding protein